MRRLRTAYIVRLYVSDELTVRQALIPAWGNTAAKRLVPYHDVVEGHRGSEKGETMKAATSVTGLLLSLLLAGTAQAQQPLPADVRAAWEKVGAKSGWMVAEIPFLSFHPGAFKPKAGDVPAFQWAKAQ